MNDLLALLPADRRREVIDEALGAQVRQIVERHGKGTLGALVDELRSDDRWGLLRDVHVSVAFGSRGPGRPARAAGGGPRRRRRLEAGLLERIVQFVSKNPGLRSEQIQAKLGGDRRTVKAALAKLRGLKRVRTSGNRRATTYTAA